MRAGAGPGTRARELFLAACERPPEERSAFLVAACGSDAALYREVVELLSYRDGEEETAVSLRSAPSPTPKDRFVTGTVLDGRYRVVRLVGRGGMGEVYQADDLRLGVQVALKFLPEWLEAESAMRRRLLEEVKLARSITHPNVCRVYDVGEADGRLFTSMEYIDGEDLATLLQRIGRPPLAKAVDVVRQVAEGLDAAHRQGILHRDLKPANLMIDADGQARITDFGLAVLAGPLTGAEVMTGTPAYMAPEQLAGEEVSVKSDLYALGLVLYELVTGQGAFPSAAGLAELLRLRRETAPVPPTRLVEGLDPAIETLILRLLESEPQDRPATAREVAAALPGVGWRPAAGQTIEARPSWLLERKLGEGGYGEVWLAVHEATGERRVFKFCFGASRLKALKREIALFRLMKEGLGDREDIARILDWNFETVPYFIESEYTGGGDLVEWAERRGGLSRVPLEVRLSIVAQVAEALSAAHSVGVLHKDVKPANVLIHVDPEGRPHARLADFGIGLLTDEMRRAAPGVTGVTVAGAFTATEGTSSGTPLYRAPELLEGKAPTLQADVYALGVVLYQIVVADFHRALGPGWERDVDDELLAEDIAAAVDKSPRRRLASAARLAERLGALDERRRQRAADRREREEAERTRAELERSRRRRKVFLAAMAALAVFAGAMVWQANRVAREAERANREAETAKQVADFLVRIFEVSDPDSGRGNAVTARELLERGATEVEAELASQPEVEARLMRTIGVVYRSLGLYQDAAPLLEAALSTRRRVWGEEHPEVAESLDDLAVLARFAGEYERAEALGREALDMRRRLFGEEHLDVATSLTTLAGVLSSRGDHDLAERLYAEALAMRRRLLGDEHPDLAENVNSLAAMREKKGDPDGAERLYREALAMRRRLLGDDHPDLARSLNNLAALLAARGDYDAAEELYAEALAMRRRLFGDEHPELAVSLNNLAQLFQLKGDLESAEGLYREALAMRRRLLGDEHPDVATSLISLGWLLWKKSDLAAAEPCYREALAIRRRLLGDEHPRVVNSLNHLARLLWDKGDAAEAERLYREALDLQRRLWGGEHPDVAYSLDNLARVVLARRDFRDAENLLREALGILRVHLTEPWRIAEVESALGAALAGLGRLSEAEDLLLESHRVLREQKGETDPVTVTARRRLADFYEARGDAEKSAAFRGPL